VIASLEEVLRALYVHHVRSIVIGGWAAILHGAARTTSDQELSIFSLTCRVVTLERLIELKRAAGRPKDLAAIAELQALLEERRRTEPAPASPRAGDPNRMIVSG
jgi:hypothetical protein